MNSASHEGAFEGRVNNNRVVGEVVHGENAASLASLPDQTFTNRALESMAGQYPKWTSYRYAYVVEGFDALVRYDVQGPEEVCPSEYLTFLQDGIVRCKDWLPVRVVQEQLRKPW
jgi:hypothetical protein